MVYNEEFKGPGFGLGWGGKCIAVYICYLRGVSKDGARLFSEVPVNRLRGRRHQAQVGTPEILVSYKDVFGVLML